MRPVSIASAPAPTARLASTMVHATKPKKTATGLPRSETPLASGRRGARRTVVPVRSKRLFPPPR
jgi:hypothetical protein